MVLSASAVPNSAEARNIQEIVAPSAHVVGVEGSHIDALGEPVVGAPIAGACTVLRYFDICPLLAHALFCTILTSAGTPGHSNPVRILSQVLLLIISAK